MSDQEPPAREANEGESKGPSRPPPTSGPPPMTATRARLLASRGQAPTQPAERATPPEDVVPKLQTRPAPGPEQRQAEESPAEAPGESVEAAPEAPARPAPAPRPSGAAAPAGPAAAPDAEGHPAPAAARPAAAPAPPPAEPEEVVGLREILPELQWKRVQDYLELNIPKEHLLGVAQRLRADFEYDYLSAVTAVDWPDRIEMVYHLYSFNYFKRQSAVVLRVDLERPDYPDYPLCPSLTKLWAGAGFQEREVYDLMGVKFVGHADLRRILLADDFPGHPLRKDFAFDYEYVLVRHLSHGVEGQFETPTYGSRSLP